MHQSWHAGRRAASTDSSSKIRNLLHSGMRREVLMFHGGSRFAAAAADGAPMRAVGKLHES